MSSRKTSPLKRSVEPLDRPMRQDAKRLFIGGERSVRRTLLLRLLVVLAMFAVVILAFWLDRDGLRDNTRTTIFRSPMSFTSRWSP